VTGLTLVPEHTTVLTLVELFCTLPVDHFMHFHFLLHIHMNIFRLMKYESQFFTNIHPFCYLLS